MTDLQFRLTSFEGRTERAVVDEHTHADVWPHIFGGWAWRIARDGEYIARGVETTSASAKARVAAVLEVGA